MKKKRAVTACVAILLVFVVVIAWKVCADGPESVPEPVKAAAVKVIPDPADNVVHEEKKAAPMVAKTEPVSVPLSAAPEKKEVSAADSKREEEKAEYGMDDDEYEQMLNQQFEAEAMETFPLHTIVTHDPLFPEKNGPARGEIWIRIKVEHAPEVKDIMAQIADMYKESTHYESTTKVMHWIGSHPHMRFEYPPEKDSGKV